MLLSVGSQGELLLVVTMEFLAQPGGFRHRGGSVTADPIISVLPMAVFKSKNHRPRLATPDKFLWILARRLREYQPQ